MKDADLDVEDFIGELEQRWCLLDADQSGLVTIQELREAVWNREPDNKGTKCPTSGKLPKALQDVVDEICTGTGQHEVISFWDFVSFVISDREARDDIQINRPADSWAYAPEERHLIPQL